MRQGTHKIIGIYQIVGGIIGIGLTLHFLLAIPGVAIVLCRPGVWIFLSPFVLGIIAGNLPRKQSRLGIYFSLFFQAIQIPAFSVGLVYRFYSGASCFVGYVAGAPGRQLGL